ncbi:MAG: transposase [Candidatus Marinimicrobia bacterium]|nr:transposase [Candidatus Neomarinimicrobiota bacterium]
MDLLETGVEDTLTCLNFPVQHRRLRAANGLERLNQEIKRRSCPATGGASLCPGRLPCRR